MSLKNQYKLKDKRAEIFRRVSYKNNVGTVLYKAQPIASTPLWCYTHQLTGEILKTPLVYEGKETRLFVFNFRADFAQSDFVRYRDRWYEITRLNTTDDYNDEIWAYVKDCRAPQGGIEGEGNG